MELDLRPYSVLRFKASETLLGIETFAPLFNLY